MPAPDTTILDLIKAGELSQASEAIEGQWPQSFFDVINATVYQTANSGMATSGSSATIGTGSRTFTLDEVRGWVAGTPVFIMEDSSPTTRFMTGRLSADEASSAITVTVETATGSGTYTAWTILTLLAVATPPASIPISIAAGGHGGTTARAGLANLGAAVVRRTVLRSDTPPGSPTTGAFYITGLNPTGAWVGQLGKWATYNGSSWTFEAAVAGDIAVVAIDEVRKAVGVATVREGILVFFGASWIIVAPGYQNTSLSIDTDITIHAEALSTISPIRLYKLNPGAVTWTFPNFVDSSTSSVLVIIANRSGSGDITANVTAGGLISGASSITIVPGDCRAIFFVDAGFWMAL